MDIKVPANVNYVMINFYEIANFDPLPAEDMTYELFDFPQNGPFNANFENTGYESTYAVMNMGSMFYFLTIYAITSLMLGLF